MTILLMLILIVSPVASLVMLNEQYRLKKDYLNPMADKLNAIQTSVNQPQSDTPKEPIGFETI